MIILGVSLQVSEAKRMQAFGWYPGKHNISTSAAGLTLWKQWTVFHIVSPPEPLHRAPSSNRCSLGPVKAELYPRSVPSPRAFPLASDGRHMVQGLKGQY